MKRSGFVSALGVTSALTPFSALASEPANDRSRLAQLRALRRQSAEFAASAPPQTPNGDEALYAGRHYIGSFSKGLPHDASGLPDSAGYRAFLAAIDDPSPQRIAAIPSLLVRALVTALADLPYAFEGDDPTQFALRPAPTLASATTATEMIELYWLALTRDVPFSRYGDDPIVARACAELNVSPQNIFRTAGTTAGPYLSQFYWADVPRDPLGAALQQLHFVEAGRDYLTDLPTFIKAQTTFSGAKAPRVDVARFLFSARCLVDCLGRDGATGVFANAAAIIGRLAAGAVPGYFDPVELQALMARAQVLAGGAIYHQKFIVHRRVRPEAVGLLVHLARSGVAMPLRAELLQSRAVAATQRKFGTALLPQAYPDGCPEHPSYPAAHAGTAGALVTMLKAFVVDDFPFPHPVVANDDGSSLLPFEGAGLTLGGELDKLAMNFALGRGAAGVHFRSDNIEGLRLGEDAALSILRDAARAAPRSHGPFAIRRFDGTRVTIG